MPSFSNIPVLHNNKANSDSNNSSYSNSNCGCFYFPKQFNRKRNNTFERKKRVARTDRQQAWLAHLKSTSRREIMSNPTATAATDYEQMQDPLHSKPHYQKQPSSFGVDSEAFDELEEEVYIVKQSYGYLAILFSLAQTVILIIMMARCGVAPINVNPMVGPYPDALSEWGGKNAVNILDDGEFWRLLTPILLHAGVIHLLCNIAVQLETGPFSNANGDQLIGFGAVMGLFGGKLAEVLCRACESTKTPQAKVAASVRKEQLGGTLCAVTLVMAFSFIPFVDWAAHLGGLVAGVVVGIPIFSCSIKTMVWRILWFVVGVVVAVASFGAAFVYMYSGAVDPAEELRDVWLLSTVLRRLRVPMHARRRRRIEWMHSVNWH
ncbi:Rhomboid-like protein [Fragilaria crotonensis]|nr:Rhomboid-like protein [Fragilaria crotonensis]